VETPTFVSAAPRGLNHLRTQVGRFPELLHRWEAAGAGSLVSILILGVHPDP